MSVIRVFAPAKINLSLRVGAPRADGRHPIESLVMFADVGDRLTLEPGPLSVRVIGPFAADLAGEGDNLILRAARLYGAAEGAFTLEKNLPVASGIGGGSADAGAALRALNLRDGAPHDLETLAARAAPLGADVPACVMCETAFMLGTGGDTRPAAAPDLCAVLANPRIAAPTGQVYRQLDAMGQWATDLGADDLGAPCDHVWGGRNDLEPAAIALHPKIEDVLKALRAASETRAARLSGSGATCFALVEHRAAAQALAARLRAAFPTWWVTPCRLGAIDAAPARV